MQFLGLKDALQRTEAQLAERPCSPATLGRLRELCTFARYAPQAAALRAMPAGGPSHDVTAMRYGHLLLAAGLPALEQLAHTRGAQFPRRIAAAYGALDANAHLSFRRAHPDLAGLQRYLAHVAQGGDKRLGCGDRNSQSRYHSNLVPALAAFIATGYEGLAAYARRLHLSTTTPLDDAIAALEDGPAWQAHALASAAQVRRRDERHAAHPEGPAPGPGRAGPASPALQPPRAASPQRAISASPSASAPPLPASALPPPRAPRVATTPPPPLVPRVAAASPAPLDPRFEGAVEGVSVAASMAMWRLLLAGVAQDADAAAQHAVAIEGVEVAAEAGALVALVRGLGSPQRLGEGARAMLWAGRIQGLPVRGKAAAIQALLGPHEAGAAIDLQLQSFAVRAEPAMLRALLALPSAVPAADGFAGLVGGRTVACALSQMRALLGLSADEGRAPPVVALRLDGVDVVAPASVLRHILQEASDQVVGAPRT